MSFIELSKKEKAMRKRKTASASLAFSGNDSYGRHIELAERAIDGVWFYKTSIGGGMVSRWLLLGADNKVDINHHDGYKTASWGFSTLKEFNPKGLRLPKVEL